MSHDRIGIYFRNQPGFYFKSTFDSQGDPIILDGVKEIRVYSVNGGNVAMQIAIRTVDNLIRGLNRQEIQVEELPDKISKF